MTASVHLYVFDGYADWERAYTVAGIHNSQYQREPGRWLVRTVGATSAVVRSMGGVAVLPDITMQELQASRSRMLILPGGALWEDETAHRPAIRKAAEFLERGVAVAAICGATAGLARAGLLDHRAHTSNALRYLKGTGYEGAANYRDEAAVCAGGLITAAGMAPLEFARAIFKHLKLYDDDVLEAWYQLHKTGKSEWFARLEQAALATQDSEMIEV